MRLDRSSFFGPEGTFFEAREAGLNRRTGDQAVPLSLWWSTAIVALDTPKYKGFLTEGAPQAH